MTSGSEIDWPAVVAALQDQVDDLTAAVDAQHRRLTAVEERLARLESRPAPGP